MADEIRFTPFAPGTTDSGLTRVSSVDPRLSRTHYFDGRLLKASDLTRDQIYLDERLREVGQALGSGIVRGLEVELTDEHRLTVGPGLAVAASGRVLQLSGRSLEVNLHNSALIASLNQGLYRRFNRGLYAVTLRYAEVGSEADEAFPADLESRRSFQFNSFAEGVELTLLPLPIPLPQSDPIGARSALVRELIAAGGTLPGLSDEAVSLGLLALDRGRPLWLDRGLVRRPLRGPGVDTGLQQDLATHYQELLADILASRGAAGLGGDFQAGHYFRLLPPFGPVPQAAIDPVTGRQGYFPERFEVVVAPVRRDDLPLLLEESARLAPMDLEREADADVAVLVPLSDHDFAWRARQLEKDASVPPDAFDRRRLLHLDRLALRLFPLPAPHAVDTDAEVWRGIWEQLDPAELVYVRRPPRAAETNVSAVVLARGFELPEAIEGVPPDAAALESELDTAIEAREQAEARAADLQAQLDELSDRTTDDRVTALQQQVADLQAQLRDARVDAQALADARAQVSDLSDRVAALQSERDALQNERDSLAGQRGRLQSELAAANARIEELQRDSGGAGPSIPELARLRRLDGTALEAAEKLASVLEGRPEEQQAVAQLATLVERRFDPVLWESLLTLAERPGTLTRFRNILAESVPPTSPTHQVVVEMGPNLGLPATQLERWKALGEGER